MNVLLDTGDKIKFQIKNREGELLEGYVQIARGGNGVHYTESGEHKIVKLSDITVKALKRKGLGEWRL